MSNEVQTLTLFSYLWEPETTNETVLQERRKTNYKTYMKIFTMPDLPNFSNENYNVAAYIVASLIALISGSFVYERGFPQKKISSLTVMN